MGEKYLLKSYNIYVLITLYGRRNLMANCPKCGKHLRILDWKQHCPYCGANVVVYDLQERLMQDADKAEVQYYHFQKKVDNVKGAFVGSPLAIARIFTSLLPVGPLFLPLIKGSFQSPFEPFDGKLNFVDIYSNIDKLGPITSLLSSGNKSEFTFVIAVILFVISLLATVLHFILNTLACSPKGKIRNTIIDIIILVTTIFSVLAIVLMDNSGCVVATAQIGAYLYIVAQLINTILDFIILNKGIEIKHAQCYVGGIPIEEYFEMVDNGATHDEIRKEQYARLQALQTQKEEEIKRREQEEAEKQAALQAENSKRGEKKNKDSDSEFENGRDGD